MNDTNFLHWFAGFMAGEGHFSALRQSGTVQVTARLVISLRDDDLDILLEIQERLAMGTVHPLSARSENGKPAAEWSVKRIADCRRLVDIFDEYPLRAKKQKDYSVWREIVLENCKPPAQRDLARVYFLTEKLVLVRRYELPEILDEYKPEAIQLSFPTESGG